jgi:putative ABC transport system permease protein
MWTLLRIAIRNVTRNRRRTLITLAALLVGVGVLVSIRGLMNGLQHAFVDGVTRAQSGAIQVHRKGYMKNVLSAPITMDFATEEVLRKVRATPGVVAATPRITFPGMASMGDQTLFMQAIAIDPKTEFEVCPRRSEPFEAGTHFGDGPRPPAADAKPDDPPPLDDGVVLAAKLAKGIGATNNALGALLAPDRDGALSGENMHMVGKTTVSLPGAESRIAIVPLALAQRLLKMEGRATEVAISVKDVDHPEPIAAALEKELGPEYEVHTWDKIATFVKEALGRQDFIVNLIGVVFMLLMLLGVANTMLMSVLERTREVGTMMAVGVRRQSILAMFVMESLMLGLLGGLAGVGAGEAVIQVIAHRGGFRMHPPGSTSTFLVMPFLTLPYLALIVGVATVGATVFGLYPAWRASKLRPVEALAGQ